MLESILRAKTIKELEKAKELLERDLAVTKKNIPLSCGEQKPLRGHFDIRSKRRRR